MPSTSLGLISLGLAALLAAVAAVTDWRTGKIPNWLTLPPLMVGPALAAWANGWVGAAWHVAAALLCGVVPYFMFRKGAMHGGDVKAFAAIGALTGISIGIEAQFLSFIAAGVFALGRLAWQGKLLRTLKNTLFLSANPFLPKKWRREITPELMSMMRLGGSIFVGTLLAALLETEPLWRRL